MAGGGTPNWSRASSADEKHALFPPAGQNRVGGARHEPLRGASGSGTEGRPPIFFLPLMGFLVLPLMSSLGLSTPGCALRRRAAPVVVDGARGNRNATSRSTAALARARDFSDNGWIAFAAAEASRRR